MVEAFIVHGSWNLKGLSKLVQEKVKHLPKATSVPRRAYVDDGEPAANTGFGF